MCVLRPLTPRATGLDWQPRCWNSTVWMPSGSPARPMLPASAPRFHPASRRRIFSFDDRNALLIEAKLTTAWFLNCERGSLFERLASRLMSVIGGKADVRGHRSMSVDDRCCRKRIFDTGPKKSISEVGHMEKVDSRILISESILPFPASDAHRSTFSTASTQSRRWVLPHPGLDGRESCRGLWLEPLCCPHRIG